MKKKFWCIATSNPLVSQVAEKYNVDKDTAKKLINSARRTDNTLNDDNVTLAILEESDAFKQAFSTFAKDRVENANELLKNLPVQTQKIEKTVKELNDIYSSKFDEDRVEELMDMYAMSSKQIKKSKLSAARIANLMQNFKDGRRLQFLGDWTCWYMSRIVTYAMTNTQFANRFGLPILGNRKEYYLNNGTYSTIRKIMLSIFRNTAKTLEAKGDTTLASELRSFLYTDDAGNALPQNAGNFDTLLGLFGGNLFREEGIKFSIDGNTTKPNIVSDSAERTNNDDSQADEDNDSSNEEACHSSFSSDDTGKSAYSKIADSLKTILYNMPEYSNDGSIKTDSFGYGLMQPLDVPKAINKLLAITSSCTDYSEIIEALNQHSEKTPWIKQLLGAISTETNTDAMGQLTSQSRKEELQAQVFRSLDMVFTELRGTYKTRGKGGCLSFNNFSTNVNHKGEIALAKVKAAFRNLSGLSIFKNGKLDPEAIENSISSLTSGNNSVLGLINDASKELSYQTYEQKRNFTSTRQKLNKATAAFKNYLSSVLGIAVTNETLNDFLSQNPSQNVPGSDKYLAYYSNQIDKLRQELDIVNRLLVSLGKYAESAIENTTENPFYARFGSVSYDTAKPVVNFYNLLIDDLTKGSPDSQESMAYNSTAKNKRYSYSLPTTVQKILRNLKNSDMEKRRKYIMKKYGKDPWFLRPDSTPSEPHFYSPMLEDLYYGLDEAIEYSEKPFFDDKEYMEQSDIEYTLNILTDYFFPTPARTNRHFFRMAISGDKKRYSTISLERYSNRDPQSELYYKTIVTDTARQAFAQEMWRAIRVVDFAAAGKKNQTKIKKYDIEVSDKKDEKSVAVKKVINKIKNKEKVTAQDLVVDGRYIFRGTGASFYFNKFLNDAIEIAAKPVDQNTAEMFAIGEYVVDHVFNHSSYDSKKDIVEADIIDSFDSCFSLYMNEMRDAYMKQMKESGMFEETTTVEQDEDGQTAKVKHLKYLYQNLINWHRNDGDYLYAIYQDPRIEEEAEKEKVNLDDPNESNRRPAFAERVAVMDDIEEFVYNNWLNKYSTIQVFDVDPAFYANTPEYQKRAAQRISSGYYANPEAKLHGEEVSDGIYRAITISSGKTVSQNSANIAVELEKAERATADPNRKKAIEDQKKDITGKLDKGYDATDGQALACLTSLRKRRIHLGGWTRSENKDLDMVGKIGDEYIMTDEAIYQRLLRGEQRPEDLDHVFEQAQKPMSLTFTNIKRDGSIITVPVQHKNSEYALQYLSAYRGWGKTNGEDSHSIMEGIDRFMEETAKLFPGKGIDTVNFDSAVKTGNTNKVIDLSDCKNGQEAYEKLKKAVLNDYGTDYRDDGVVTEYDASDYKIVTEKGEHYKRNHQPSGSQFNVLVVGGVQDNATATLPSGEQISGKELKTRYLAARKRKTEKNIQRFKKEIGASLPYEQRIHFLSNAIKDWMATDDRFTPEMRDSVSVVERDGILQFNTPLDESQIQPAIEAMILSKVRKAHYELRSNGGIIVQATSWGSADDLGIRFYSNNPEDKDGLVPTKNEFGKSNNLSGAKLDKEYKAYCDKHQTGFAHMEIEISMPEYVRNMLIKESGSVAPYKNADGTWNMEAIKEVVPDSVFDAICYRLPTEAKYSMMLCKVKRFSPEGAGSVAKYPSEIVVFTGSDFDIDTDTVELRPVENDEDFDTDEELFNLEIAALRMNGSLLESFRDGDFSDVKELSYYLTLLENGYSTEELENMSPKELKDKCDEAEDKDIMNPTTDIILYRQNADAKQMIAVAAVGVTSHAFISLYNDIDVNDPERNPQIHPENYVRIRFSTGSKNTNCESFYVINDKNPANVTTMHVGGELEGDPGNAILDPSFDMDGKFVGTEISKYVGGSADAAKDAALYRLNINMVTLPILVMMHRLGISSDVARLFISNPVIKHVAAKKINNSSFGKNMSLEDAIENTVDEYIFFDPDLKGDFKQGDAMYEDIKKSISKELRYSSLLKSKADPSSQSLQDKMTILAILNTLNEKSRTIRNLDSFTRYNSRNTMRGSSLIDRIAKRESIKTLRDNLNKEKPILSLPQNVSVEDRPENTEYDRLCAMFPYIAETIHDEEEITGDLICNFMKTYSPSFFEVANRLGIMDNAAALKKLYAGYKNYLLFTGDNKIADFSSEAVFKYYTLDFAKHFTEERKKLLETKREEFTNNQFLDMVEAEKVPDGYKDFDVLKTNILGLKGVALETFKKDWESLLDYPESRQLAIDTAIHFLARSAAFSRNTPVNVMPERIKDAIPNYKKAFANAGRTTLSAENIDLFTNLFMRHNYDDTTIVPHFYNTEKTNNVVYGIQDGVIFLRKGATSTSKALFTDSETKEITSATPVICLEENGEMNLFALLPGTIGIVNYGNEEYYSVPAMGITPLGIPNQVAEYVGGELATSPVSMFYSEDTEVQSDDVSNNNPSDIAAEEDPGIPEEHESSFVDYNEWGLDRPSKTGTFLESAPFGKDSVDVDDTRLLHDSVENNDSYLETRTHMRRVRRLANAMGFNVEAARKSISNDSNAVYDILITPGQYTETQHEDAIEAAAIISSLGYKSDNIRVKTYVSEESLGDRIPNAAELSFFTSDIQRMKRALSGIKWVDWNLNTATGEVTFTQILDTNDMEYSSETIAEFIQSIREFVDEQGAKGLIDSQEDISINYCDYDRMDDNTKLNILNNLRNETAEDELASTSRKQSGVTGSKNWKQVGFIDILDLAIKREKGEKVDDQIRELFGERHGKMISPKSSYESRKLVNAFRESSDEATLSDIQDLMEGTKFDGVRVSDKVDNLIINTANWIRGNMPSALIQEALESTGLSQDTSTSIIKLINEELEKQNIC